MIARSVFLLCAVCTPAHGEDPSKQSSPPRSYDVGPIRAQVEVPRDVYSLSDVVEIGITLSAPGDVQIRPPLVGASLGGCTVLDFTLVGEDPVERWILRRWKLRLEPMQVGETKLPALNIEYKTRSVDWTKSEVPLPTVMIVPGSKGPVDISTLRPFPLPKRQESNVAGLLKWSGLFAIAAVLAIWLFVGRSTKEKKLSLHESTLAELKSCEERISAGHGDRAIVQDVCRIFREYLSQRFEVPVLKQTTPEVLADGNLLQKLSAEQKARIDIFLPWTDFERFSTAIPNADDCLRCVIQARDFVQQDVVPS